MCWNCSGCEAKANTVFKLVDVRAALNALAPELDLLLASGFVSHPVPAFRKLGRCFRRGHAPLHHQSEVLVKHSKILLVVWQHQERGDMLGILQRDSTNCGPNLLKIASLVRFEGRSGCQKPWGWAMASSP